MKEINKEKFWSRVEFANHSDDQCWYWVGSTRLGYGNFYHDYRTLSAHRTSYELFRGKIPDGLVIDHLCKNTLCVNPQHLEPVTQYENISRSDSLAILNSKKTHCKNGHEFTPENIIKRKNYPNKRNCKICYRLADKKRYWMKKELVKLRLRKKELERTARV